MNNEQIRELILGMADTETSEYSKSYKLIYKTQDRRFLPFAIAMLRGNDETEIVAALNTILYVLRTAGFYTSGYLSYVLPCLDNPNYWVAAIKVIGRIGDSSVFPRLLGFLAY